MRRVALTILISTLFVAAPAVARDCDRACAVLAADSVFMALQSGQAGKALPRSIRITENGRDIRLADSQLFAVQRVIARQTLAEPVAGAVGIIGAAEAYGGPAIFAVRVKLKGERVSEVETLVVRRSEASVFAPTAVPDRREPALEPPVARRSSRADLVAIATAWSDGLPEGRPGVAPVGPDCVLLDNGVRAATPEACQNASASQGPLRDRRLVLVDEDTGRAWVWAVADLPETSMGTTRTSRTAPRSMLFAASLKIEDGQLRQVERVQRSLPLGAASGWTPPRPKSRPSRSAPDASAR